MDIDCCSFEERLYFRIASIRCNLRIIALNRNDIWYVTFAYTAGIRLGGTVLDIYEYTLPDELSGILRSTYRNCYQPVTQFKLRSIPKEQTQLTFSQSAALVTVWQDFSQVWFSQSNIRPHGRWQLDRFELWHGQSEVSCSP